MINALDKNSEYLMTAKWFKRDEIVQSVPPAPQSLTAQGVTFKCKLLEAITQESEYPVKNLVMAGDKMRIETLYNVDIRKDDFVFVNDKWWAVEKVLVFETENKEKTLGLMRLNFSNKRTVLQLVQTEVNR